MIARRSVVSILCMMLPAVTVACGGAETGEEMEADTAAMEGGMAEEMGAEGEMAMAEDPFHGMTHEASMGTVTMADGHFTYRAAEGDSLLVEGSYEVHGDTFVFVGDDTGPIACGERGVYTFEMVEGEPEFTLVEDPCEGRRAELTGEGGGERGDA